MLREYSNTTVHVILNSQHWHIAPKFCTLVLSLINVIVKVEFEVCIDESLIVAYSIPCLLSLM